MPRDAFVRHLDIVDDPAFEGQPGVHLVGTYALDRALVTSLAGTIGGSPASLSGTM